jgi:hypothetical protein
MANIDWPWAIVLCKFTDKPDETRPAQYYVDFYTENGLGGVCDYWRTVSCHALDLTNSEVFGWFTMSHASSELTQLHFPGDRSTLVQWGIDTAQANGVDLSRFRRTLIVQNYGVDHGAAGNGILIAHGDPAVCEFGFICHEMGHGFGLPHSFAGDPDMEYGDGWDVMSFATTTPLFTVAFQGSTGWATVGLNARNVEQLGAMPARRVWSPPGNDFSESVTLDPLSQPPFGNHGFLVVKIPPSSTVPARPSGSTYQVEFHRRDGWDQAIPQDTVLVHEVRTNGLSFLQRVQLSAGMQYVTPDPRVYLRVVNIDVTQASATVRLWNLPERSVRKEDSKPSVYQITGGQKRHITSPAVLFALGYTWADVKSVPDAALDVLPTGAPITLLSASISPHPVPVNQATQFVVTATDMGTGAAVAGDVKVNGKVVGATNTQFSYTFKLKRVRVRDPVDGGWTWEFIAPTAVVSASGYPDSDLDLGIEV